jgi:hypothetical protein
VVVEAVVVDLVIAAAEALEDLVAEAAAAVVLAAVGNKTIKYKHS